MNYSIEIKEEALEEINQAYTYYESEQENLGERFIDQLERYMEQISSNPNLFEAKRLPFREAFIQKFPYVIIYEILEKTVVIYSVFNTYRNPQNKYDVK